MEKVKKKYSKCVCITFIPDNPRGRGVGGLVWGPPPSEALPGPSLPVAPRHTDIRGAEAAQRSSGGSGFTTEAERSWAASLTPPQPITPYLCTKPVT